MLDKFALRGQILDHWCRPAWGAVGLEVVRAGGVEDDHHDVRTHPGLG